ncbi:hypothetical protein PybrP1_012929, partial [[Pythium] brassicae (nom. inval.)]
PTTAFRRQAQPGGGFYPVVQYERLTPSVSQRPPSAGVPPPAPNTVHYERMTPSAASGGGFSMNRHSPNVVQYERLTPATAGGARTPSIPAIRQNSPLDYDMRPRPSPASGFIHDSPAPSLASLPSPGMLTPLSVDVMGRSPIELRPIARAMTPSPALDRASGGSSLGSASDKSTPFSAVMEEWMSQLRTPTPDVTLLPSPYDFNKELPTPTERPDDLKHINSALLPTPPPDVHDQTQNPKSSEYILNVSRRPLVEDIASLCRDLISHDSSARPQQQQQQQSPGMLQPHGIAAQQVLRLPSLKKFPGPSEMLGADVKRDVRMADDNDDNDDDDDDDEDKMSVSGSGSGGGRGKRRKMCTADGCSNLSRSRGLCKAHGGGRRCSVDGCTRASQSGSLCITHGGGKRCTVDGCVKAAQSRGMCKAHGGGVRCRVDGCTKSSQGDGFCRSHGGGRRCGHLSGCTKWAQRNGMCMAHSEGRYGNSYRGRLTRMQDSDRQEL